MGTFLSAGRQGDRRLPAPLSGRPRRDRRGLLLSAGRADLHVHTYWSDGIQSPDRVVTAAAGRVDVLAITDHDEIRGALRSRDSAAENARLAVDIVVGEEVSTLNGGHATIGQMTAALREALTAGHLRAQVIWSWTVDKLPHHLRIQLTSLYRFVKLRRRLSAVARALPHPGRRHP